jgi:predicted GH43/DUF377 family glycosyl hydrolase
VNEATDIVRRSSIVLRPDAGRVITRPFLPGHELPSQGVSRADSVVERLIEMPESDVERTLAATLASYADRHLDLRASFLEHYQLVAHRIPESDAISSSRAQLIGAYLTHEYSIEAAALLNPSIAAHPDQSGLAPGELRFVMTARAVGEGHVSSLEFRAGTLAEGDVVRFDELATRLTTGRMTQTSMSTEFLHDALDEDGDAVRAQSILGRLPEQFSPQELEDVLASTELDSHRRFGDDGLLERIRRMAASSYELAFSPASDLSSRVIFPSTAAESHGIEDARLVRFTDADGSARYYATYTAFDGSAIAPHLLSTDDFETFSMRPQVGPAAKNKGMALFPRHIGGRFWSLSRWDRESISVASSRDALRWGDPVAVLHPSRPWDLIQLGGCSSPMETAQGWLVITHGVGPMRTYALGALLLDLDDPRIVLGSLSEPLMTPRAEEREGYVPNVLYSCGGLIHEQSVVLPYGCSDSTIRFAFIDLPGLLARLLAPRAAEPDPAV